MYLVNPHCEMKVEGYCKWFANFVHLWTKLACAKYVHAQ